MRSDYDVPGTPQGYGPGRPMTKEEKAFLMGLKEAYWEESFSGRYGAREMFPRGVMTTSELARLSNIICDCRLPTTLGSGMFGLPGYSMYVYDSPEPQGFVVPRPAALMALMNTHMPWNQDEVGTDHQGSWTFFTGFTHSPENLVLLDYYGLGRPEPRGNYDY